MLVNYFLKYVYVKKKLIADVFADFYKVVFCKFYLMLS